MSALSELRLWGYAQAFDHPATVWICLFVLAVLGTAVLLIAALAWSGRISPELRRELWLRTASWALIIPVIGVPVLVGALPTILAIAVIALWCYREYVRATGLFREKLVSAVTVLGIVLVFFAALDHWYGFFVALVPLGVVTLAAISIPLDRPSGYIQRTGLAVFGFLLFGSALGHLAYMANDWDYRPIILLVLLAVGMNDVLAFAIGKTLGGPKLLPRTSPGKTLSGALGALLVTTLLVTLVSGPIFVGSAMEGLPHRIGLGLIIGGLGQFGDLMLSSIKRDIGIKDMGEMIPGHGGMLDRFDSLLLVAPAVFHYVGFFRGFGLDQPTRILSGG